MKIEFKQSKEEKNTTLLSTINKKDISGIKETLVDHVGKKMNPTDDEVTVAMVVEVLTEEFPELILALAEENFIRGYQQAFNDIETTSKIMEEDTSDEQ